ncbi:beta-glucosidase BglX [Chishuiella sp.]|uniref:beta-glucosidase BglX n=1 Tax=Chishuiella sp. TaxID=1969467 RepID=UPI0028ADE97B|nr:beta-glucosidase BglX [Chishuiella sp.]
MKKLIYSIAFLGLAFNTYAQKIKFDKTKSKKEFIDYVMGQMTLDDKVGQMVQYTYDGGDVTGSAIDKNYIKYTKEGMMGSVFNATTTDITKQLQKIAVEETRLGIPLIFGYDVIHGYETIFPIPLGEASSWDLKAIQRSAEIAAAETSAGGVHWTFAPMVDIGFDPRWGRISEGAGEDTYLGSKIGAARVKGFQGNSLYDLNTVLACTKHFAGYALAQAGRDYNSVEISDRFLRDYVLPPFKATIDAGVGSFMTSFNEIGGVPSTASKYLYDQILRKEWNYNGFVVTDYTAIQELIPHGIAKDLEEATLKSVEAGIEMDMMSGAFLNHLSKLVKEGKVKEDIIDTAVRRILEAKYDLGLFEDPYRYSNAKREKQTVMKKEFLDEARDIARKSMVLLKNDQQVLPLKESQKVAVIGPLVKDEKNIIGNWAARGDRNGKAWSVWEGLNDVLGKNAKITYAQGTDINSTSTNGFQEAINIAKNSDVIVAVMGENENQTGEATSQTNIDLPGNQKELLKELKKLGKPIVLVLMSGRPMTISWENDNMDAILYAWYPGTMGGLAITDVLYGKYNPSAKTPMTFPRSVGQIPIHYNQKNTGRPYLGDSDPEQKYKSRYTDSPNSPLFPFGYGLSYTTFDYSNLKLNKSTMKNGKDEIKVSVNVKNTGNYDGEEVVQLYVRDLVGSVTRPVRELKGFDKVMIKKGETKTVTFTLTPEDLKFHDINMNFVAEPGDFDVYIGTDSNASLKTSFTLVN